MLRFVDTKWALLTKKFCISAFFSIFLTFLIKRNLRFWNTFDPLFGNYVPNLYQSLPKCIEIQVRLFTKCYGIIYWKRPVQTLTVSLGKRFLHFPDSPVIYLFIFISSICTNVCVNVCEFSYDMNVSFQIVICLM